MGAYKGKVTIFRQLMIFCLTPVLLVFILLLILISRFVYKEAVVSANNTAILFSEYTSNTVEKTLLDILDSLNQTVVNLQAIDRKAPDAEQKADQILQLFFESNTDIYCTWFAFERGTFQEGRYTKDYIRTPQGRGEIFDLTDELLDDEKQSTWYNAALKSGEVFFDDGFYDYGNGPIATSTISYPIKDGSTVIGVLGIDTLYNQFYQFLDEFQIENEREVMLVSVEGRVLYSKQQRCDGAYIYNMGIGDKDDILRSFTENETLLFEDESPYFGGNSLHYFCPISFERSRQPMFLYVDLPTDILYEKAQTIEIIIVIAGILTIFLLAAIIFFQAKKIRNALSFLAGQADQIANGNLDIEIKNHANGRQATVLEVVQLHRSLKKMVEQFRIYIKEKENFNNTLEQKIEQRTFQLEAMTREAEKAKQQAEYATEVKTQFLASMSHEIRTPMNAILGISELMLEENLNGKQGQYVNDIKTSSKVLVNIVNDILDITKLEAGKLSLQEAHYDFKELIGNISSMMEILVKDKGISYCLSTNEELPAYLFGDDLRLRQILTNILGNAIKFTKEGYVELKIDVKEDIIQFVVTDTGIGIKDENLKTMFDPFIQLDTYKNRNIQGTGLGLSICKKLVDMMKGTIAVSSEYGKGSVFTVVIPKVPGDANRLELADKVADQVYAPNAVALVVDDNKINVEVAAGLLGLFGIEADKALSGYAAIAAVQGRKYDLIFMDHMMTEMDGLETTQCIRALGGECETIPIIALTANAVVGAKEMFLEAGMNDFLSKPVEKESLNNILHRWLPKDKQIKEG
ncbi:ATP-binding protein [Lachnospiraceae bacterium ZAX-1]